MHTLNNITLPSELFSANMHSSPRHYHIILCASVTSLN